MKKEYLSKVFTSCLAILVVVSSVVTGAYVNRAKAAADSVLYISPASSTVAVGDTFSLDVMIDPGDTNEDTGVSLDMTFPQSSANTLRLDSISTTGSAFPLTMQAASIDNTNGTASIVVAVNATTPVVPVTVVSKVVTLNFTALGAVAGAQITFASSTYATALNEASDVLTTRTPASVTVTAPDSTAPVITAFTIHPTSDYLLLPITSFTATDAVGVTAWMVKETATNEEPTAPAANDSGWNSVTSATDASISGNINAVAYGTRYFWAYVKDAMGNVSDSASASAVLTDITAPVLSGGTPTGTINGGITQVTVAVTTDEAAICKYSTQADVPYDDSASDPVRNVQFTTTGGTTHSFIATGITDSTAYAYYVRCQDTATNANTDDYIISFGVSVPPVVVASSNSSNDDSDNNDSHKNKKEKPKPARYISNSKTKVARGDILTQRGKKFSKNTSVLLYFSKYGGSYYAPVSVKTSKTGMFLVKYRVNKPKGTYYWYAVDTKTGKNSKKIYYRVR